MDQVYFLINDFFKIKATGKSKIGNTFTVYREGENEKSKLTCLTDLDESER